jgi:hypothetical protein
LNSNTIYLCPLELLFEGQELNCVCVVVTAALGQSLWLERYCKENYQKRKFSKNIGISGKSFYKNILIF